jgi:hypothetical protein
MLIIFTRHDNIHAVPAPHRSWPLLQAPPGASQDHAMVIRCGLPTARGAPSLAHRMQVPCRAEVPNSEQSCSTTCHLKGAPASCTDRT